MLCELRRILRLAEKLRTLLLREDRGQQFIWKAGRLTEKLGTLLLRGPGWVWIASPQCPQFFW
jgi:hypothetical protein